MWQDVIVGLAVLAALAYLLRKYIPGVNKSRKNSTCGGCSGCSSHDSAVSGCAVPEQPISFSTGDPRQMASHQTPH